MTSSNNVVAKRDGCGSSELAAGIEESRRAENSIEIQRETPRIFSDPHQACQPALVMSSSMICHVHDKKYVTKEFSSDIVIRWRSPEM
jgi:hypothetical protein